MSQLRTLFVRDDLRALGLLLRMNVRFAPFAAFADPMLWNMPVN